MVEYKIKHSNTDIRKLWNLARNGVFSYKTINGIFENSENSDFIVFKSKQSYKKYLRFEFSSFALFDKKGN